MKILSKSALLVAVVAGVTFTSCKDDNKAPELPALSGELTEVTMRMQVKNYGTRAVAEDAGYSTDPKLTNLFVVPMVGDIAQDVISFTDVTTWTDHKYSKAQKASIDIATNRFLVYGNLLSAAGVEANKPIVPSTLTFGRNEIATSHPAEATLGTLPVYFFRDTKQPGGTKNLAGYYATNGTTWSNDLFTSLTPSVDAIGKDNNMVKVDGVTYAVGTLVVGVYNMYDNAAEQKYAIYTDEQLTNAITVEEWNTKFEGDAAEIKMTGITVDKQAKQFSYDFTPSTEVGVAYDNVMATSNVKPKPTDANGYLSFGDNVVNGEPNIYMVVAPDVQKDGQATVNIEFEYTGAAPLYFGEKNTATGKVKLVSTLETGKFYLAANLSPDNKTGSNDFIFAPATTTLLNAKVTNWQKFTDAPQTTTDVEIGIEVDLQWKQGNIYDVEI